jgi:DNA (cytosine-5)-methyltransferase 1
MKHLDLFSGIGGFALAAEWAFGDVEHVFCDFEPFSQTIIKKHWPNSQIHGDIRQLTADSIGCGHVHGELEKHSTESGEQALSQSSTGCGRFEVDILTGGFPCQPFSQAGRRRGTEDDRHLWPQMLRVIRETSPRWVVGENVGGLLTWNEGLVFEQVCTDLENEGYEVQSFVIPAVSVNAPHRRDRVWIVAHAKSDGGGRRPEEVCSENGGQIGELHTESDGADSKTIPDTRQQHDARNEQGVEANESIGTTRTTDTERCGEDDTNPERTRRPRGSDKDTGRLRQPHRHGGNERGDWDKNWLEVATELCTLDDGLPNGLARPRGWRNAALKGAGNAIVPQVAYQIMLAIKAVEDSAPPTL